MGLKSTKQYLITAGSTAFSNTAIPSQLVTLTETVFNWSGGYLTWTQTGLPTGSTPRTVEAMVYFATNPTSNDAPIIGWGSSGNGAEWNMDPRASSINDNIAGQLYVYSLDSGKKITDFGLGTWIHLCMMHNGTNQKIYINGTLYATTAHALATGSSAVGLGYRAGFGNVLSNGTIREARIWNIALTDAQVLECVNTRFAYNPKNCIFYSRLNTTPSAAKDLINDAAMTLTGSVVAATMTYDVNLRQSSLILPAA